MSDKIGSLIVEIAANMARFESDMRQANRTTQDTMRRMGADVDRGVGMVQRSLSGVAGAVAGAFTVGSVIAFTRETVNAALAAEKLNMQFKASTGSAQLAAQQIGYVRNLSNQMGMVFQSTATQYSKFLAATRNTSIEGVAARRVFEGVSEAITALHLSADEASGIFYALQQMMSKGKVSAEELNGQLGERLPGAMKLAADAMGMTTAELMKMMAEGKVMSADLLPKLAEQLHKTYGEAAKEASQKGQAGINRFNNEVKETAALIGSKALPAINEMANAMAGAMKQMREGDWGFHNASANLGLLLPGQGSVGDRFALPKAGQSTSFAARDARIAASQAAAAVSASGGADPQRSRAEADRRYEQDRINASRAAAEKVAAGAAERERAATSRAKKAAAEKADALRKNNDLLHAQNQLLEQELQKWDELALRQSVMSGDFLQAPSTSSPKFSLGGLGETLFYGNNSQNLPPVDYSAAQTSAQELSAIRGDTAMISANSPTAMLTAEYDRQQELLDELMLAQDVYTTDGLAKYEAYADQRIAIDKRYIAEKKALENAQWGESAMIISDNMDTIGRILQQGSKDQFEAGKKFAIASALINTYMAASSAFAGGVKAAPGPWGVALGVASAAVAVGAGMAQVAAIDAQRYEGREMGGPVNAGQTYIVGEKRPELFTPNQSGYITPYVPKGGKAEVTQVFQISTGVADTVRAEIQRFAPAMIEMSIQGVKSAMRSGEFQGV